MPPAAPHQLAMKTNRNYPEFTPRPTCIFESQVRIIDTEASQTDRSVHEGDWFLRIFKYFLIAFSALLACLLPGRCRFAVGRFVGTLLLRGLNKRSVFCFHKPTNNFALSPAVSQGIIRIGRIFGRNCLRQPLVNTRTDPPPMQSRCIREILRNTLREILQTTWREILCAQWWEQPTSTLDARSINCMLRWVMVWATR